MEKLEKLSATMSEIADELFESVGSISYSDFKLVDKAKEKVIMAGSALIVRENKKMTDDERELVQKLIEASSLYISFIARREREEI